MIELEAVGRRFGRVDALRDVSLRVDRGSVVAVVGPNGAGKSTLFALVLGFLSPTAGRVTLDGTDPRVWVRARGVGYLPERFALPTDWPVGGALRALTMLERADSGAAERALARWGLDAVAERRAGTLSRGLLQRVGLAQATLVEHPLVVLDEPTEGLDPVWRIRLRDAVRALKDGGATVLLASHDLAEVERVADRVILLNAGRVVKILEPKAVSCEAGVWRLRMAAPMEIEAIFPGAVAVDSGVEFVVRAEDGRDLSARLAALLAQGAQLESVVPESEDLEARVRRALEPPGG